MTVPNIKLNNGVEIPQMGFGVFQIDPAETADAVKTAIEVGYRHIDTAEMYRNEAGVHDGIEASDVARDKIFITSKLNNSYHRRDDVLKAFDATMASLQYEQLDLFLIHWPLPTTDVDYVETWKAMEEIYKSGRVRSIGVSNFQVPHLQRILDETETVPVVNQIELHPYLTNTDVKEFGEKNGIHTEAWSPIAQGGVLQDAVLVEMAERYGKTPAQVTLRWHIEMNNIIFPKSTHRERMVENFDLFDFELKSDDIDAIAALNKDERTGANPDDFDMRPDFLN